MQEQTNAALLKQAYEYWDENKEQAFENWMNMIADDVSFSSLANGIAGMEFTRHCNCKNDVFRYFEELARDWEMLDFKMTEFVSQGDRVVAIGSCKWRFSKTGKEVESPKVDIFRLKDGKIVEFMEMFDTARAVACTQPDSQTTAM